MSNRSLVSGPYKEDGSQGSRLLHSKPSSERLDFAFGVSSQFGIDSTSIERRVITLKLD